MLNSLGFFIQAQEHSTDNRIARAQEFPDPGQISALGPLKLSWPVAALVAHRQNRRHQIVYRLWNGLPGSNLQHKRLQQAMPWRQRFSTTLYLPRTRAV